MSRSEILADAMRRTSARLRHGKECQETVVRKGMEVSCGNQVVALRDFPGHDFYYAVCARHTRGCCLPLVDPDDAATLLASIGTYA